MGLDHPSGSSGDYNQSMTAMSYNRFDVYGDGSLMLRATGPMYFDIRAIQEKYGVNTSYQGGHNNYTFNGSQKLLTLWDGGGNDTIDASNHTVGVGIDLRHDSQVVDGYLEHLSAIGETFFYIAYGADIENATGGSGADYLAGSDPFSVAGYTPSTGNNHLIGNEGEDWIEGNGGSDTIDGGDDADWLFGGEGNDMVDGGNGDDDLEGGNGNDSLAGSDGNDFIDGGDGDDTLSGGWNNNTIPGGGLDWLDGGSGDDVYILSVDRVNGNTANSWIQDSDGELTLRLTGLDGITYGALVEIQPGQWVAESSDGIHHLKLFYDEEYTSMSINIVGEGGDDDLDVYISQASIMNISGGVAFSLNGKDLTVTYTPLSMSLRSSEVAANSHGHSDLFMFEHVDITSNAVDEINLLASNDASEVLSIARSQLALNDIATVLVGSSDQDFESMGREFTV